MLHFFYQALADPSKGADDPLLPEIATLLKAKGSLPTIRACFAERKEQGLGFVAARKIRADVTPEWVIQVSQCVLLHWRDALTTLLCWFAVWPCQICLAILCAFFPTFISL